jgi:hypothetical protein
MFDLKNRPDSSNVNPTKKPKKPCVTILRELPREFARLGPSYLTRRATHPAFAPYPTLDSLVKKLTQYTPESREERLALIGVLIELHRQAGHRVWTALLLRVFRPMLNKIREKLVGGTPEDLDAALVTSFLEAIRLVDTAKDPPRTPRFVRWRTRRLVFRALKVEASWEDVGFGEDHEVVPDPCTEGELLLIGVWLREENADAESIELVRTLFERGALSALVRRRHGELSPKEHQRVYRRLQDKRLRLIRRFRRRLRSEMDHRRGSEPVARIESLEAKGDSATKSGPRLNEESLLECPLATGGTDGFAPEAPQSSTRCTANAGPELLTSSKDGSS